MASPSTTPTAALELASWSVESQSFTIEYSPRVLEEIRAEAVDGLLRIRRGGIEVGGVLFGVRKGKRTPLLPRRAFRGECAQGPSFLPWGNDERAFDSLIPTPTADPGLSGLEAVGWYHSH